MKTHLKYVYILSFLIIINILLIAAPALSLEKSTTTRIIVVEDKVICFDLPKEFASIEKRKETDIGRFIDKIDEETCKVNVDEETIRCYIPQEYKAQIVGRLQPGVYVYLIKNIRGIKQTQWDIISIGTVVSAGDEYCNGIIKPAELSKSLQAVKEFAPEEIIARPELLPEIAGKIISIQGELEISIDNGKTWGIGTINQMLYQGIMLHTGKYSRAAILLSDETQMKIHEQTTIVLKSVQRYIPKQVGKTSIHITGGQGWFRAKRPEARFEITTPIALAAIRGTEVNMKVDEEKEHESTLTVVEGNVDYSSKEGSITLTDGEQGIASKGQPPIKVLLVTPEDAVQWSLYYLGVVSYRDYPFISFDREVLLQKLQERPLPELEEAKIHHDLGDLDKAEAILKGLSPDDEIYTLLGWISLEKQDIDGALDYFNKIRAQNLFSILGRSKAYYIKGQIKEALDVIEKDTDSPQLLTQLGYLYMSCGLIDEAFEYLNKAVQIDSTYWLAYGLLSNIYIVTNKIDLAKESAEKALMYNPYSPSTHIDMSIVYQALFDLDVAKEYAKKAVDLAPKNPFALFHYAKILFGFGYNKEAEGYASTALIYHPKDSLINTLYGFILFAQGKTDKAIDVFKNAIQLDSTQGQPHLGLGLSYFRKKRYDEGIEEMLIATLLEPKVSLHQSYLGKSYFQLKRFTEAEYAFNYAKKLDPKDPTPYLYSGNMKRDLWRYVEAVEDVQKSIELNDNRAVYRSRLLLDKDLATRNIDLAETYKELGLTQWAYKEAIKSIESDITNGSAHLFLAKSMEWIGGLITANLSETFQSLLLRPVNQNLFNTFNDYTSMLEVPYNRLTWRGQRGTYDWLSNQIVGQGGSERYAYLYNFVFNESDGTSPGYDESRTRYGATWTKLLINQDIDMLLGMFYLELDQGLGLTGTYYDPEKPALSKTSQRYLWSGFHYRINPGSDVLLYASYEHNPNTRYFNYLIEDSWLRYRYLYDTYFYNVQGAHLLSLDTHQISYGIDLSYAEKSRDFRSQTIWGELDIKNEDTDKYIILFAQDIWNPWDEFYLTCGLEYKDMDEGNILLTGESVLDLVPGVKVDQLNPRIGFKYGITEDTILRGAVFRSLETGHKVYLSPTNVAGFVSHGGETVSRTTDKWEYDIGIQHQINDKTFTSLDFYYKDTETPRLEDTLEYEDLKSSKIYRVEYSFEKILNKYLAFSTLYKYFNYETPVYNRTDHAISFLFTIQLPSWWKIQLEEEYAYQEFSDVDPYYKDYYIGDSVWATNLYIKKELPDKIGNFYLAIYNIFDETYNIRQEPIDVGYYLDKLYWEVGAEIRF